jgi:hypothetical protein
MKISYQPVIDLLSKKLTVQTLKEFIKQNSEELEASFTTAHLIEDYVYLSVMAAKDRKYDDFVIVYFPTIAQHPITLKKDAPLDLVALAKLYVDFKRHFAKHDFYSIIEREGVDQAMEPTSLWLQFDLYVDKIINIQKLKSGDVGRNDTCPCGSTKKYKNCHGSIVKDIGTAKELKDDEGGDLNVKS